MKETENALVALFGIGKLVKESLSDDGKINFRESMQISMSAIGLIPVFKALPKIREELKNSTIEQRIHAAELLKEKFDLANDEAEQNVELGIDVLLNLVNMVWGKA